MGIRKPVKEALLYGLAEGRKEKEKLIGIFINVDLEKENEQLKAQIEKVKCCGNCKHRNNYNFPTLEEPCKKCLNYSKWELAE